MIRAATHADVPQLIALGRLMHAESPHYRGLVFDDAKAADFVHRMIASKPGDAVRGWVMVAEWGGEIVGYMGAMAWQEWFTTDFVSFDFALYVLPDYRGGMLAARMVSGYRDWARSLGAKRILGGVSTGVHSTARTAGLYQALGAVPVGPLLEFPVKD